MNRDRVLAGKDDIIGGVIKFFFASVLNKDDFDKIVSICEKHPTTTKPDRDRFREGWFCLWDYIIYTGSTSGPKSAVDVYTAEELLRRFCEYHLLFSSSPVKVQNGLPFYRVNTSMANFFFAREAVENLAFDIGRVAQRYSNSVLRLSAKNSKGDLSNGTGFLCNHRKIVLTNKHVVEGDVNHRPRVFDNMGRELSVSEVHQSPTTDIAMIRLSEPLNTIPFYLMRQIDVLDEIVTLGYPRIPLTRSAPMVAHKGEINGSGDLSGGERLIFSARTGLGNSGGPLVNRGGLVVGMVTEDLRSQENDERRIQPYFAAIPSSQLADFCRELLSPEEGKGLLTPPPGVNANQA